MGMGGGGFCVYIYIYIFVKVFLDYLMCWIYYFNVLKEKIEYLMNGVL